MNNSYSLRLSHELVVQGESAERKETYLNTSNEHSKDSTQQYCSSKAGVGGSATKQGFAMRGAQA